MNNDVLISLIKRLKKSDHIAFKQIFEHFHEKVFNFLVFKINDAELAEDLLQDTFVRLWENRQILNEKQSITSYIFTIAGNLVLNHIRHKKVILKYSKNRTFQFLTEENPHNTIENKELNEIIVKTIDRFTDRIRMVFLLSRVEKLSYKEIAERLNIEVSTVESHMVKALKILRKEIRNYHT
jgi:RNA polymerase sigma-70 factor (family 1)